ncbi:MAG TPA: hypothetical protein VIL99_05615 [Ignavibacteria bacterium]
MAYQKRLSSKARTDLSSDRSDYEELLLPNPEKGPWACEESYVEILDLEFFTPKKLKEYRKNFYDNITKHISVRELLKIESYIKSFTNCLKNNDDDKNIIALKKSLLKNTNILLKHFNNTSNIHKQFIPEDYFENSNLYYKKRLSNSKSILEENLNHYRNIANKYTIECLIEYGEFLKEKHINDLTNDYGDVLIYRGLNNSFSTNKSKSKKNILSIYSKFNEPELYFESNILTSYTLCWNVAEKFMVAFKGRRRAKLYGDSKVLENRILSSFIISTAFLERQYEILVLPNEYDLFISEQKNDEDYAEFMIERKI